jgi:TfoX/Sxy family transcriptional regulator of competence genes
MSPKPSGRYFEEATMATDRSFIEYVTEQSGLDDRLSCKRMFGEYGIYIDGRIVAFACDNSLFVKAADATAALTANLPRRPPYPGAKPYPVADELLDDSDQLQALLVATAAAMPEPKARKPRRKGQS